jgi:hypothetical protein
MKIVVVNVNTSESMTGVIAEAAVAGTWHAGRPGSR